MDRNAYLADFVRKSYVRRELHHIFGASVTTVQVNALRGLFNAPLRAPVLYVDEATWRDIRQWAEGSTSS